MTEAGAPTLAGDWRSRLESLAPGWDSYGGETISQAAIETLGRFATVPRSDGGVQLEIHRDGYDIEIVIAPDGGISSVMVCHEAGQDRAEDRAEDQGS